MTAKAATSEQHQVLHGYWPPPECCLCGREKQVERLKVLVQEMRAHLLTIFTTEADWKASRKVLLRRVRKELANAPERF